MGEYKNVLARKFTRETNYRIICDTDNLEDLENQWFEFNLHMTPRQQRLSDDKSIEIWGMTNQEHYETLRDKLIQDISDSVGDNEDLQTFSIDESAVHAIDRSEEVSYVDNPHNNADKFETDSNMHIIGKINGETASDKLRDLERQYGEFETLSNDQKRKSDDECRRLYGVSNLERYNKIKANLLARYAEEQEKSEQIKPSEDNHLEKTASVVSEGFVGLCNANRIIRESRERKKVKRRLNDLPYFTPAEMIDMGVHGHDNYYSDRPDNSKLVTDIKVPLWFASYKDMCMDHIFEDYRKDWIDTLRNLYSDYEEIKESGDTERILSRKQSILDLGWNPEIPFTSENRQKATDRVNNIIETTMVRDIFIDLDSVEVDEEMSINESINKDEHHPVFLIFNKGKTPIVSSTISAVTKSEYTHASISFSPDLNETYSYVMNPKVFGLVRETLKSFGNTVISVYAFFVDDETMLNFKQRIHDFSSNRTQYDFTICLNKILGVDAKYTKSQYSQVCSTFVDNILKSGNVNIVGDTNIPAPADLYNGAKKYPNKIIRVFEGIATKYNVDKIKSKLDVLYRSDIKHIHESAILSSDVYHRGIHTSEEDDFMLENINDVLGGVNPYSTKLFFHVSYEDDLDKKTLSPRIPSWIQREMKRDPNFGKEMDKLKGDKKADGPGFEEYKTPRVCFSNSINGCLNGIINEYDKRNLCEKAIHVYIPEKPISEYKTKSNKSILKDGDIFDANITNEMWILEPVKVKYYGTIMVDKIVKSPIKRKFANNRYKIIDKFTYVWHWVYKADKDKKPIGEANVSDIKGLEFGDSYYNIDNWESGKSNIIWVTGLSGSGKTTIAKEIAKTYKAEYVELDNLQRAKMKNWDYTGSKLLDSFIEYKGGLVNVFPYVNDLDGFSWSDLVTDSRCADQFNELFEYIFEYVSEHKTERFVIEGVQISFCSNRSNATKMSKCPVIIKDANVVKAELRREKRLIKQGIDNNDNLIDVIKKATRNHVRWIKNKFYLDDLNYVKDFKSYMTEDTVLTEVKRFPLEFDDSGNLTIYKCKMGNIAYGDEINESSKLLSSYRNVNNQEGIKYELARVWFIIQSIENRLKKKKLKDEEKIQLNRHRTTATNVFKTNLSYLMKLDNTFNFIEYYNSTPFSDNGVKITAATLRYSLLALKNFLGF